MKKRKIFIDLRYLSHLTNGFGQLSLYYGDYFLHNPEKYSDLDITLLVPEEYVGKFGNQVKYIRLSKLYKFFPFLLPKFDVTHSLSQQIKYTPLSDRTFRILTIHDFNYLYEVKDIRRRQRKYKRTQARIKLADLITVISQFTDNDLKKNFDAGNIPVIVIYNGLRDITKDEDRKPDFIDDKKKFFFTIGEFGEKKNFHVLIDMMKLMPQYNLYICGNNKSGYGQKIAKQVRDEKVDNVFLPGRIGHEEKVWMYKNCYAFLFPSKFEGFGIPVIDAMRFDKPVFSSDKTSLKEIGGEFAFFWNNFEPHYMKNVIEENIDRFYADDEFRERQMKYASSFSIEKQMDSFFDLYRNVKLKDGNFLKTIKNYLNFMKA